MLYAWHGPSEVIVNTREHKYYGQCWLRFERSVCVCEVNQFQVHLNFTRLENALLAITMKPQQAAAAATKSHRNK